MRAVWVHARSKGTQAYLSEPAFVLLKMAFACGPKQVALVFGSACILTPVLLACGSQHPVVVYVQRCNGTGVNEFGSPIADIMPHWLRVIGDAAMPDVTVRGPEVNLIF